MNGRSKQKSGPCYSNVSLIKRALYQSRNGSLPYPDIILYMQKNWTTSNKSNDIKLVVDLALNAKKSFFLEDENGLWGIKKQEETLLDEVVAFANAINRPFQLKEVIKKVETPFAKTELQQSLRSDLRFTEVEGTDFWLLSSWELINDLVYKFMQENNISNEIHKKDILKVIKEEFNLNEETYIFSPEIDNRFNVKRNLIQVDLVEFIESEEPVEVPIEIREEVARQSLKITNMVESAESEFSIKKLIPDIFNIRAQNPSFNIYYQAVEEFLNELSTITYLGNGTWIKNQFIPDVDIDNQQVHRIKPVFNSKPVISNVDLLKEYSEASSRKQEDEEVSSGQQTTNQEISKYYHTISYYERVKGHLILPKSINSILENEHIKKLKMLVEGSEYECWLTFKQQKFYCFGNGIFDFYTDYLIEPGQRLKVELNKAGTIIVSLMGIDETYYREQSRYLDIGKINDEITDVNKSVFTIICEILSTYPSGIHWSDLLDKVNEIRSTTRNTITNLLSKNSCFYTVPEKRGYWGLELSKLSRYYVDDNGIEVEESIKVEDEEKIENLEISQITSSKPFIISFIDKNKYRFNQFPFFLKERTDDGYYNYSYHWDLREGKDREVIVKLFPNIIPDNLKLTDEEITNHIKYNIYLLIKNNLFSFYDEGEKIFIKCIWTGKDVDSPEENLVIKYNNGEINRKKTKTINYPFHFEEEEYQLPPLEETFKNWAQKQKNTRYSNVLRKVENKQELIDILTRSYSKHFCKFASSRITHSIEFMDLVQEGFFGLIAAIDNYNQVNSFAHYLNIRLLQHFNRFIADNRLLIRIPVHKVEEILKLEKLISTTLLLKGRYPTVSEIEKKAIKIDTLNYLLQSSQDYVSFEQYWFYLNNDYCENGQLINPWVLGDIINNQVYRFCINENKNLVSELHILTTIVEQDSEMLWQTDDEKYIEQQDLRTKIQTILSNLSDREQEVIKLRYGLDDDIDRSLEVVGNIVGVTRERIRQIESKALGKLEKLAKRLELEFYL
ncbi:sigma-70 family RNA polymerase sigma factor [Cytobacillus firmus]|uniref:sigma-70 family RNA polymerase sigma factor n=1 Tax=Cytobacillus firmus TaxID=1399 RepID=UPI001C8EB5DE|nr:sigma-70 family RNA polymerase sigma factor [Cytobacillus firmus]MBX9975201.1 sigma-70 family RNA polymerase sigma factor [Cytobacillus firmus]